MNDQRDGETWREYIERELDHLSEKIDLRLAAKESALKLQAAEYERRLKELNHEAARLKDAAALAVSREKYEADRKGDQLARRNLTFWVLGLTVSILGIIARAIW